MTFFKLLFRPVCKPTDAITKRDLLDTENALANSMASYAREFRECINKLMRTLDDILADVREERTIVQSLAKLTAGIKGQLDEILGGALPPDKQAKVDAIFEELEAAKKEAADAVAANTTTPPTPPA